MPASRPLGGTNGAFGSPLSSILGLICLDGQPQQAWRILDSVEDPQTKTKSSLTELDTFDSSLLVVDTGIPVDGSGGTPGRG